MIEQELLAVQQRPEEILQALAARGGCLDLLQGDPGLARRGVAA